MISWPGLCNVRSWQGRPKWPWAGDYQKANSLGILDVNNTTALLERKKTNILNIKCLLVELENHARIEFEQDPHHHPLLCQELVSVVMHIDTCMPSDHSANDITWRDVCQASWCPVFGLFSSWSSSPSPCSSHLHRFRKRIVKTTTNYWTTLNAWFWMPCVSNHFIPTHFRSRIFFIMFICICMFLIPPGQLRVGSMYKDYTK